MILNDRVMTYMIPTPHDHIATDAYEGLYRVVLKDEAVFADVAVSPYKCLRADVGSSCVAFVPGLSVEPRSQPIGLCIGCCYKEMEFTGGEALLQCLERHDRKTKQMLTFQISLLNTEGKHLIG